MSQFFIVPYSLLPGHNAKTVRHISAEHCAQLCVHDDLIVCRSFDYHVSQPLDQLMPNSITLAGSEPASVMEFGFYHTVLRTASLKIHVEPKQNSTKKN